MISDMDAEHIASRIWRYLTFAAWTWSDRDEAARIRAGWPMWRKAVRPIGASAVWAGIALKIVSNDPPRAASIMFGVIAVLCAVYGIVDGAVARRSRKRDVQSAMRRPLPATERQ